MTEFDLPRPAGDGMDPEMARVLAAKTERERRQIARGMYRWARRMLQRIVQFEHGQSPLCNREAEPTAEGDKASRLDSSRSTSSKRCHPSIRPLLRVANAVPSSMTARALLGTAPDSNSGLTIPAIVGSVEGGRRLIRKRLPTPGFRDSFLYRVDDGTRTRNLAWVRISSKEASFLRNPKLGQGRP